MRFADVGGAFSCPGLFLAKKGPVRAPRRTTVSECNRLSSRGFLAVPFRPAAGWRVPQFYNDFVSHRSSVDPEVQRVLESHSWSSSVRRRSVATGGRILTALLVWSCLLPIHCKASGAAQAAPSIDSKTELWPISIDYPQDGAIFPPGITPPTIIWRDAAADSWKIEIVFGDQSAPLLVQPKAERMHFGAIDPECISSTNELPRLTPQQAASWTWTPDAHTWQAIQSH